MDDDVLEPLAFASRLRSTLSTLKENDEIRDLLKDYFAELTSEEDKAALLSHCLIVVLTACETLSKDPVDALKSMGIVILSRFLFVKIELLAPVLSVSNDLLQAHLFKFESITAKSYFNQDALQHLVNLGFITDNEWIPSIIPRMDLISMHCIDHPEIVLPLPRSLMKFIDT